MLLTNTVSFSSIGWLDDSFFPPFRMTADDKTCQDPIHVLFAPRRCKADVKRIFALRRFGCTPKTFFEALKRSMESVECVCWWWFQVFVGSDGWCINSTRGKDRSWALLATQALASIIKSAQQHGMFFSILCLHCQTHCQGCVLYFCESFS